MITTIMKIKALTGLFCLIVISSGCATVNKPQRIDMDYVDTTQPTLLKFLATAKAGDKKLVIDLEKNNEEGTAIIRSSYLAASGRTCRSYQWIPADAKKTSTARNLYVACQTAAGIWQKIRPLSNMGELLEREPVGYVLQ